MPSLQRTTVKHPRHRPPSQLHECQPAHRGRRRLRPRRDHLSVLLIPDESGHPHARIGHHGGRRLQAVRCPVDRSRRNHQALQVDHHQTVESRPGGDATGFGVRDEESVELLRPKLYLNWRSPEAPLGSLPGHLTRTSRSEVRQSRPCSMQLLCAGCPRRPTKTLHLVGQRLTESFQRAHRRFRPSRAG